MAWRGVAGETHGVCDLGAEEGLRDVLHVGQHHGADLDGGDPPGVAHVLHLHHGRAALVHDLPTSIRYRPCRRFVDVDNTSEDNRFDVESTLIRRFWRHIAVDSTSSIDEFVDIESTSMATYLEGPLADVLLHLGVVEAAPNEPFGVEHGVGGVGGTLALGGVPD